MSNNPKSTMVQSCRRIIEYQAPNMPPGFKAAMHTSAATFDELRQELRRQPLVPPEFFIYVKEHDRWHYEADFDDGSLPAPGALLEIQLLDKTSTSGQPQPYVIRGPWGPVRL